MKKEQFRSMVKEIIKEVISEMDTPALEQEGKMHNQYPKDDKPGKPGTPDGKTSDQKIQAKNDTLKKGVAVNQASKKMQSAIHGEPDFQSKLKNLRQQKGDEPLDHK